MDSLYPNQRFAENLTADGIPKEKQDLLSLLEMLPRWLYTGGENYLLYLYRDDRWNAAYATTQGSVLHQETGTTLADAVARLTVNVSERGHLTKDG